MTQDSRQVKVADASKYDLGAPARFNDGTNSYMHTIIGASTTTDYLYLDRAWASTTTSATLTFCPKEATQYLSLYPFPNSEENIVIRGSIKPTPLVADTDISMLDDEWLTAVAIGAIKRDESQKRMLTEQRLLDYDERMRDLQSEDKDDTLPYPNVYGGGPFRERDGDEYSFPGL